MSINVKFCGISTGEALDLAAELGAWKAGFIFFPKSPRHVSLDVAGELGARARTLGLETVAVAVDPTDEALAAIVRTMRPDWLQLHGKESPERVSEVRARFGLPVMKALSIRDAADLEQSDAYRGHADLMLFDAKPPAGAELPGGNGVSFDWRLLEGRKEKADYVLSGGLTTENVGDALALTGATMIDVSSGIERAPGVKDPARMRAFAEAVARAAARGTSERKETIA